MDTCRLNRLQSVVSHRELIWQDAGVCVCNISVGFELSDSGSTETMHDEVSHITRCINDVDYINLLNLNWNICTVLHWAFWHWLFGSQEGTGLWPEISHSSDIWWNLRKHYKTNVVSTRVDGIYQYQSMTKNQGPSVHVKQVSVFYWPWSHVEARIHVTSTEAGGQRRTQQFDSFRPHSPTRLQSISTQQVNS